jgi:hypothetical protein
LKCQIFIARAFATYQVLNKTDEPIGTSLSSKIKLCLDFMDKNVRVNQTELDRLQQEQEKIKRVPTKAGLKTTGLDDDDDDMRSTSTGSESSSESSSSVDDDDDDDDDEEFDFEQLWGTIRLDVVNKMEHHLKKKKPLPKSPPGKNNLPTGVYNAYSRYKSQVFCYGKTRYIGTWSKPEQAAKAYVFMQDVLLELKNKKTRNKKQNSLLQKKKKKNAKDDDDVDDGSRSRSGSDDNGNGNDKNKNIINSARGANKNNNNKNNDDDDNDNDPNMAHFNKIKQRRATGTTTNVTTTNILPCKEREKELLMSFRIMQNEMQILFRRVNFFKTQLEDHHHRQIFKNEIKDKIINERRKE